MLIYTSLLSSTIKPCSLGISTIKKLKKEAGQNSTALKKLQQLPHLHIKMQSTCRQLYAANVDIPTKGANANPTAKSTITAEAWYYSPTSVRSFKSSIGFN